MRYGSTDLVEIDGDLMIVPAADHLVEKPGTLDRLWPTRARWFDR